MQKADECILKKKKTTAKSNKSKVTLGKRPDIIIVSGL